MTRLELRLNSVEKIHPAALYGTAGCVVKSRLTASESSAAVWTLRQPRMKRHDCAPDAH
jgi:hypothetical protein